MCEMKYIQKTQLRKHMDAIHLKKKDYTCTICGENLIIFFKFRLLFCKSLLIFSLIHFSNKTGKSYSRDTTLSKHMFVHKLQKDVVCSVCGFRTHTKPKMDRHTKSHTGERNYACEICGKKFLYSYNVIAHVKYVHNREKRRYDENKLICQLCGKKFQKLWKKKEHMAEVHKIIEKVEGEDFIIEVAAEEIEVKHEEN